ncbi:phage holin family protein [Streptomyces sp. NPDC002082]|uniref:phage holin family protein n=1 Tax=Streptomyces sp. NPDC002082 TaxID=3154772 RepID=UPI0033273CB1
MASCPAPSGLGGTPEGRECIVSSTAERRPRAAETAGGLLGAATLLGVLVAQAVVVSGIAALALVLPVWASALIVAAVLAAIAGVLVVAGKKQIARAVPPVPEQTVDSVKADVAEIKERAHR